MNSRYCVFVGIFLVMLTLVVGSATGAEAPVPVGPIEPETLHHYERGLSLLRVGRYERAIARFEKVQESQPNAPGPMWNIGVAALAIGDFQKAQRALHLYAAARPTDWEAIPMLIQAYQGLNNHEQRDVWLERLLAARRACRPRQICETSTFVREQQPVPGGRIVAVQHYDPQQAGGTSFELHLTDHAGAITRSIALRARDTMDPRLGTLRPGEQMYLFDLYADGVTNTLSHMIARRAPSYDEVRERMVTWLAGPQD